MVAAHLLHLVLVRLLREGVDHVGLGRVDPEGVDAPGENALLQVLPVHVVGLGVVGVVVLEAGPAHGRVEEAPRVHLLVDRRVGPEAGPDRDHQVVVQLVEAPHHLVGLRVAGGIEDHPAPARAVAPVVPVLDDVVDRDRAPAVLLGHLQQLVLRVVVLLALPVAVGPLARTSAPGRSAADSRR